jgi:hypothetical protein
MFLVWLNHVARYPYNVPTPRRMHMERGEQVRYKDLLIARLEDRLIQLPPPEPTEQKPELLQPGESGNVLSQFWHWFIGK